MPLTATCPPALLATLLVLLAAPAAAGPGRFTPIGPEGGDVRALHVDPSDAKTVYAGTRWGGVFKSTDGGESWRRLPVAPTNDNEAILDLAIDPSSPATLYVTRGGSVLKSRDGGATFADAGAGIRAFLIPGLALDPRNPQELWAATTDGLYASADGGGSWRLAGPDLAPRDTSSVALDPRVRGTLYAGLEDQDQGGVWKSTDAGATWAHKTRGLPARTFGDGAVQVVVDPEKAGRVFATYASFDSGQRRVNFRSTDGGETWSEMAGAGGYPLAAGHGGLVQAGARRSTDGGDTWAATPLPGAPFSSLLLEAGGPAVAYAGSADRGVAKSTDAGRTWKSVNRGLWATEVQGLAVDARAAGVLYAGVIGERLWARPLAGAAFRLQAQRAESPGPLTFHLLVPDPQTPRGLYAYVASTSVLLKSGDGGKSFTTLTPQTLTQPCFLFGDLAVDPASPDVLYAGGEPVAERCGPSCGTFRSRDGGASWSCMEDLDRLSRVYAPPSQPPGTVFAVSTAGLSASADAGASWRRLRPDTAAPGFLALAFDPRRAKLLYAGAASQEGEEGIWRSADGGVTWAPWSRGFPLPVSELIVDPRTPSTLYAAVPWILARPLYPQSPAGVYRSTDAGRTWSRIPGFPGALFDGYLALDPVRGTLYAGTRGQGVFAAGFPAR